MSDKRYRPRKPTVLKLIDGTHEKKNPKEPKPSSENVQPPADLIGIALDEWQRLAPELHRLGLLTVVDAPTFAAYCRAYARWSKAEASLAKMAEQDPVTGALMIRTSSGTPIQNPLVGTARRAAADMVRYAVEFGMTPASRSRIQADAAAPMQDDPLRRLLGS